jgi:hypothetical protein
MFNTVQTVLGNYVGKVLEQSDITQIYKALYPANPLPLSANGNFENLTFHHERFHLCVQDVEELCRAHWAETEGHRNDHEMKPNWPYFIDREAHGAYTQFVARNEDGEMVGHMGTEIMRSTQDGRLFAKENALYFKPEYRNGKNALAFGQYCEQCLAAYGVEDLHCSTRDNNNADKLLIRLGFDRIGSLFIKRLSNVRK